MSENTLSNVLDVMINDITSAGDVHKMTAKNLVDELLTASAGKHAYLSANTYDDQGNLTDSASAGSVFSSHPNRSVRGKVSEVLANAGDETFDWIAGLLYRSSSFSVTHQIVLRAVISSNESRDNEDTLFTWELKEGKITPLTVHEDAYVCLPGWDLSTSDDMTHSPT